PACTGGGDIFLLYARLERVPLCARIYQHQQCSHAYHGPGKFHVCRRVFLGTADGLNNPQRSAPRYHVSGAPALGGAGLDARRSERLGRSKSMLTRRDVLQRAGTATALATTASWWLVRRAHAARQNKLVVWNPAALAPQVDKIMQEQCYAYLKQAGIKESEIDYSVIGGPQLLPKLVASLEAGNPPDITRLGSGYVQLYRSQGHLLEMTDLVNKMQQSAGGLFPISLPSVMYKGKAYGVPQSVSPWPLVTRMDIHEAAKVDPPKTWDEFIEVCKKLQKPPRLTGFGLCLGLES